MVKTRLREYRMYLCDRTSRLCPCYKISPHQPFLFLPQLVSIIRPGPLCLYLLTYLLTYLLRWWSFWINSVVLRLNKWIMNCPGPAWHYWAALCDVKMAKIPTSFLPFYLKVIRHYELSWPSVALLSSPMQCQNGQNSYIVSPILSKGEKMPMTGSSSTNSSNENKL